MSGAADVAEYWFTSKLLPSEMHGALLVCALVLLCVAGHALSVFLRRSDLHWGLLAALAEDGGGHDNSSYRSVRVVNAAQIDVAKLHSPFLVKLADNKPSSLADGANVEVFCDTEHAFYRCYWGVGAEHLFRCFLPTIASEHGSGQEPLLEDWPFSQCRRTDGGPSDAAAVVCCSHRLPAGESKLALRLVCPDVDAVRLALCSTGEASPCAKYPLVIVCWTSAADSFRSIVAYATVIHLTSEACRVPSSSLYEFVRTRCGLTLSLQRLYAAGRVEAPATGVGTGLTSCVVCLGRDAECVLLPCRHLCVCRVCANSGRDRNDAARGAATPQGGGLSIDTCPLCRALVVSYFSI